MIKLLIYFFLVFLMLYLVLRRPAHALVVALCMFALDQWGQVSHPFFLRHSSFTNILAGSLVLLAWCRSIFFSASAPVFFARPTIHILSLLLISYAFISSVWSLQSDYAFKAWFEQLPYFGVVMILTPLLLRQHVDYVASLKALLVVGIVFVTLFAFFVTWQGRWIIIPGIREPLALPLALAQMGGQVFIMAVLMKFKKDRLWVVLRLAAVIISLILVLKTGSRGQFFAMLFSCFLFFPMARKVQNIQAFIGLLASVAIVAFLAFKAYSIYVIDNGRWDIAEVNEDAVGRFSMGIALLRHWLDGGPMVWFFGLGNSSSFDPGVIGFYPHNVPLEILGEEGLLGFGLFILIVSLTIATVRKAYRLVKNKAEEKSILAAMTASAVFTLIISMKSGSFVGGAYLFLFPVLIERYYHLVRFYSSARSSRG